MGKINPEMFSIRKLIEINVEALIAFREGRGHLLTERKMDNPDFDFSDYCAHDLAKELIVAILEASSPNQREEMGLEEAYKSMYYQRSR